MSISSRIRLFQSQTHGSLSIMIGFVFLAIIGAVGGAVDISNAMRERTIAQRDLDAALLSTFRNTEDLDLTQAEREERVRTFLNDTSDDLPADAEVIVTKEGDSYAAQLNFASDNAIMGIIGFDTFDIGVRSIVTFGAPRPMELALVLDTTGSMAQGDKLATMQDAARDLVTSLTDFDSVKIALVPFSQHVNVGIGNRNAAGLDIPVDEADTEQCTSTPDMSYSNCRDEQQTCSNTSCSTVSDPCTKDGVAQSCSRQECRTDSTYQCTQQVCDQTPTGTHTTSCQPVTGPKWLGCVGSREYPANTRDTMTGGPVPGFLNGSCAQPVVRLTGDKSAIVSAIDAFVTNGETFIAPALLWGARMISSEIPFPDGATDTAIQKTIVLMSDGANTISKIAGNIQHTGTDRAESDALLLEVCDNIKAQGITILTVAYDIDDAAGRQLLQDCATPGSNKFFDAQTDTQLADSFGSIAKGFKSVRISH